MGETLVALKGRLKPSRRRIRPFCAHPGSMPSVVELAKRALAAALTSAARTYDVRVDLNQDSTDAAVRSAYRRVFRRAHPDTLLAVSRKCRSRVAQRECFPHIVCRTLETQFFRERRQKGGSPERITCGARQGFRSGRRQGSSWIDSEHNLRAHMAPRGGRGRAPERVKSPHCRY